MSEFTKPPKKAYRFCSQCKRSKYVKRTGMPLQLYCSQTEESYSPRAQINGCVAFDPERKEDALKT